MIGRKLSLYRDAQEKRIAELELALRKIAKSAEYQGAASVATKLGRAIDIANLALHNASRDCAIAEELNSSEGVNS